MRRCSAVAVSNKAILSFLAVALLVVVPCRADGPSKLSQAVKLYEQKQYRQASDLLAEHLKSNKNDATAFYYSGMCCQSVGQMSLARYNYEQVVRISPTSKIGQYAAAILAKIGGTGPKPSVSVASSSSPLAVEPIEKDSNIEGPTEARVYFTLKGSEMFVPVEINGHKIDMQIDTGAGLALSRNQLSDIGIQPPTGKADGASGGSSNSWLEDFWNMKVNIKVGPMLVKGTNLRVYKESHGDPLIGQGFLSYFDYTIDKGASCIHFKRKGLKIAGHSTGYTVPFQYKKEGRRIILEAEINGKKKPVMLDTGNTASELSFHSTKQAEEYGARVPKDAGTATHTGITGSGQVYKYNLSRMRVGPIDKSNVDVCAHIKDNDDDEAPLLGQPFFEGWQMSIDMKNKVIHLLRR